MSADDRTSAGDDAVDVDATGFDDDGMSLADMVDEPPPLEDEAPAVKVVTVPQVTSEHSLEGGIPGAWARPAEASAGGGGGERGSGPPVAALVAVAAVLVVGGGLWWTTQRTPDASTGTKTTTPSATTSTTAGGDTPSIRSVASVESGMGTAKAPVDAGKAASPAATSTTTTPETTTTETTATETTAKVDAGDPQPTAEGQAQADKFAGKEVDEPAGGKTVPAAAELDLDIGESDDDGDGDGDGEILMELPARRKARFHNGNAEKAILKGRYRYARKQLRKAVSLDPTFAPPYRNLGVVYARTGKRKAAKKAYEEYIRLAPTADDAPDVRRILGL